MDRQVFRVEVADNWGGSGFTVRVKTGVLSGLVDDDGRELVCQFSSFYVPDDGQWRGSAEEAMSDAAQILHGRIATLRTQIDGLRAKVLNGTAEATA
jgi:hypothetical protein